MNLKIAQVGYTKDMWPMKTCATCPTGVLQEQVEKEN